MKSLPSSLPWTAYIDGNDVLLLDVHATCFGGAFDSGDSGSTESGVMNDGRDPNLMGIALPIRSGESATRNSPLANPHAPHIPWFTKCIVWQSPNPEALGVAAELIDNGPNTAKLPTHALDLNPNLVLKHFAPHFDPREVANRWSGDHFNVRILGAAQFFVGLF